MFILLKTWRCAHGMPNAALRSGDERACSSCMQRGVGADYGRIKFAQQQYGHVSCERQPVAISAPGGEDLVRGVLSAGISFGILDSRR